MRVVFHVFSGTGNTFKVCKAVEAACSKQNIDTVFLTIEAGACPQCLEEDDLLVLGYPIHAFNAPKPVYDYVKLLPQGSSQRVWFIKTSGEYLKINTASSKGLARILSNKGYVIAGESHLLMPYNIIFRHSDEMAARMWESVQARVPVIVQSMIGGDNLGLSCTFAARMIAPILRIEHIAFPLVGRFFHVSDACIKCGKCIRQCPVSNIASKDGIPRFGRHCCGCMRCVLHCPKNVISTGLFNGWKVNGAYRFDATSATDEQIPTYCHKSYLRYFREVE